MEVAAVLSQPFPPGKGPARGTPPGESFGAVLGEFLGPDQGDAAGACPVAQPEPRDGETSDPGAAGAIAWLGEPTPSAEAAENEDAREGAASASPSPDAPPADPAQPAPQSAQNLSLVSAPSAASVTHDLPAGRSEGVPASRPRGSSLAGPESLASGRQSWAGEPTRADANGGVPGPREAVLAEPGQLGRTERLWGFWLRQAAQAGRGCEDAAADSGRVASAEALAAFASGQPAEAGARPVAEEARARPAERTEGVLAPAGAPREAPEAPREAQAARPATPPAPAQQVAQAVRVAMSRGGERVTVRLEPENLGKVQVVLAREPAGAGLTAHLRVDSPQAHQALTAELPLLRQALEARGVNLVHVQVDLADGRTGQRPGDESWGRRRRGTGAAPGATEIDELSARAGPWRPWGFEAVI